VTLDTALAAVAALDADALARPWPWRGRPLDRRNALYLTQQEAHEALVRAATVPHPESRRILALAQGALGDLRGLLAGLPAGLLDQAPAPGEWSVRDTLGHVLLVERRYALQTRYAVDRSGTDPVRLADDRLPSLAPADVAGDVATLLAHLVDARAATNRALAAVPAEAMTRPTIWAGQEVDVRFRLHRFTAHLVEHTIQCEKTLGELGWAPTEGRRIARRLAATLGELEGLGADADVRAVLARLAERLA
jgi:uncharacterized damage-inducible protein DinB